MLFTWYLILLMENRIQKKTNQAKKKLASCSELGSAQPQLVSCIFHFSKKIFDIFSQMPDAFGVRGTMCKVKKEENLFWGYSQLPLQNARTKVRLLYNLNCQVKWRGYGYNVPANIMFNIEIFEAVFFPNLISDWCLFYLSLNPQYFSHVFWPQVFTSHWGLYKCMEED